MPVQLNATTGGGNVTITAPSSVTGTKTLTVPGVNGNIITSADSGTVTGTMLASATVAQSNLATNVAGNGPAFYATTGGATATLSHNTATIIPINTKSSPSPDTGNYFNTTTYTFTPTIAGYYFVSGTVSFNTSASGGLGLSIIWKNGVEVVRNNAVLQSTIGVYATATALVYLGTSDYIQLYGFQNSGSSMSSVAGTFYSYLARSA